MKTISVSLINIIAILLTSSIGWALEMPVGVSQRARDEEQGLLRIGRIQVTLTSLQNATDGGYLSEGQIFSRLSHEAKGCFFFPSNQLQERAALSAAVSRHLPEEIQKGYHLTDKTLNQISLDLTLEGIDVRPKFTDRPGLQIDLYFGQFYVYCSIEKSDLTSPDSETLTIKLESFNRILKELFGSQANMVFLSGKSQ